VDWFIRNREWVFSGCGVVIWEGLYQCCEDNALHPSS